MSFDFLAKQINQGLPFVLQIVSNGKARFISQSAGTDASGFLSPVETARTTFFSDCVWKVKIVTEESIAMQVRNRQVFELSFPVTDSNQTLDIKIGDFCELKAKFDSINEVIIKCEVLGFVRNGMIQTAIIVDLSK